jgi:hypothetical protein
MSDALPTHLQDHMAGAMCAIEKAMRNHHGFETALPIRVRATVAQHQVGSVENEVPGVVDSPVTQVIEEGMEFAPAPPIIRDSVSSDMKILTTSQKYPQLNGFTMLRLSDRLVRTEAEFFHAPHTTRILWGGHRVVYIFTEATGRLNLYYDIELKCASARADACSGTVARIRTVRRCAIQLYQHRVIHFHSECSFDRSGSLCARHNFRATLMTRFEGRTPDSTQPADRTQYDRPLRPPSLHPATRNQGPAPLDRGRPYLRCFLAV